MQSLGSQRGGNLNRAVVPELNVLPVRLSGPQLFFFLNLLRVNFHFG